MIAVRLVLASLLMLFCGMQIAGAQSSSTLVAGDVIKIAVYGNPDLTSVARVSASGNITFPLIGEVEVGGRTPAEAERAIAARLSGGGYVRNAAVTIFVQERSTIVTSTVTLLGQVTRPGKFLLDKESAEGVTSLIGLLAKAGGTTKTAADYCFVLRQQNGQWQRERVDLVDLLRNANIEANLALKEGDVVLVPEMDVFYIYGEVQRPGRYRLERDMTVMQAVAVASGLTPRGSDKGIVLNRREAGKLQTLTSKITDQLIPNDVVYVKSTMF